MQSEAAVVSVTFLFKCLDLQSCLFRCGVQNCSEVSCLCINHSISIRPGPLQPASTILRPSASNDEGMQPPAAFDEDYHKNHSQLQFYQFGPDRVRNMIFLKGHTLTVSSETFLSAFPGVEAAECR